MKPLLVGQAPARSGDGRPFDGRSGRRLCELLGVAGRDELMRRFELRNLISRKLPKRDSGKGDVFLVNEARAGARAMVRDADPGSMIVACGNQVWRAFGCPPSTPFFGWDVKKLPEGGYVMLWHFPHPSGISHFWNDARNVADARCFLEAISIVA